MPESMTQTFRRAGGLLGVLALLTGCASTVPVDSVSALTPFPVTPVDAAALGLGSLISFDVYVDAQTVHALFAAETAERKKPYIGYLQSSDGGLHWSAPVEIGHYGSKALESRIGNDVQIAASGDHVLAVWQVSGEIPGMGPLFVVSSEDGGQHWRVGANPAASDLDQSHADLAADSQGRFHLVWLDDRDENGHQGLRYARSSNNGLDWQQQQTIDDSSCSCCWNRLLISADDHLQVLYRDMEPRDMALAQSVDGGQGWQRTATVGEFNWVFNGCPHNGGGLAYVDNQTWHSLVWTGADSKVGLYHLQSADAGRHWSTPHPMEAGLPAFHSDIAIDDAGRVVAIWDQLGGGVYSIVFSQSDDQGGQWMPAQILSTDGSASFPRLLATEAGLLAMWVAQKPGASKQWQAAVLR